MSSRKRVREAPKRYEEPTPPKICRGEFSDAEDTNLLAALLKYGPQNVSKLAEMVPTRNEYQVKQRISALQKKAQLSLTSVQKKDKFGFVKYEPRDKVALDRWLDHLTNLHEKAEIMYGTQEELPVRMIARSMGLIAKYENHPKPEEIGGVSLINVYEFLENMMQGLPSKTLNFADSKFLIEALHRLSTLVDSASVGREKSFVMCGRPQWRTKGQAPRTYGKVEESPEEPDRDLKIFDSMKFNPFHVPLKWLKKDIELP